MLDPETKDLPKIVLCVLPDVRLCNSTLLIEVRFRANEDFIAHSLRRR